MKLVLVAIATLVSLSLGGGPFNPNPLNTSLLALSDSTPQSNQQTPEIPPDVRAQIEKLTSTSAIDRAEAACRLGELKATQAIPALIKLLGDDNEVTQPVCGEKHRWGDSQLSKTTPGEMAAVSLSRMGRQAVEPLIGALKSDVWQARANSAFALGLLRDDRNVEPLITATRDSYWQVRSRAVWSLGLVGDYRAVEPLTLALKDGEEKVRSQAAWALGLKGDERSIESLIAALNDSSPDVQSQAA
ncbi:MAG TPA: HEAT repeat domain-containing protein, partial [Pyrinomonadaceae bacterium]|nr:HEAT repeat domain-containing protein [Pyrinomonadaceae bacterium]